MKDDSDRILRMLDRYYDGVASPEEVDALSDFFRKTDMALLPEDMRADAEMFRRLEADLSELEVDVPQGLEDDIRSAVVGLGSPTAGAARHRGRIIRLAPWAAAGAAAVGLLIGFVVLRIDRDNPRSGNRTMVHETAAVIKDSAPEPDAGKRMCAASAQHVSDNAVVQQQSARPRLAKDSYIEINSPEEAAMLAQDAFSLIRDKLALAKNSIADVNGGLNQMGETMQSAIID